MAATPNEIVQAFVTRQVSTGPVTASRRRRAALIYAAMCALGVIPLITGMSAASRAAGLGLWIPGGGFLAVGGWAMLLFPVAVALFGLAVFAWFASGMVVAPIVVWLGSAWLAGSMAEESISTFGAMLVPALVAGVAFYAHRYSRSRREAELARFEARKQFLPSAIAEVIETASPAPSPEARELAPDDLAALRYLFDRALQPIGELNGYDRIDQFQTSALRYQINNIGYALAMVQCHYAPNFHGYLARAQRNLIELYLDRRIWSYWIYESAWGHLNLTNPDPAGKDNIMLTGWFGLHVGMYMLNSGDRRYAEPGSLPFRLSSHRVFHHDIHSLEQSVLRNFLDSEFCLYPCEPNWVYPICNHFGMASLAVYDRLFGTRYVKATLDRWLQSLDKEFTDLSGSVIGLRSALTGLRFPFPAGEAGFAIFENCFAPERAQRMWAIARHELKGILKTGEDGERTIELPGRGFDFGNYRPGWTGAYASIMDSAREFGDEETAAAAQESLDRRCGRSIEGGVLRYIGGSNLSNILAARARIHRRDDFRIAVTQGPGEAAARGPILAEVGYPDVLVARARSDGEALDLVLYPGKEPGPKTLRFGRLKPGRRYMVRNGKEDGMVADGTGAATLTVDLRGRTPILVLPAA
jgi:hypothetical protein